MLVAACIVLAAGSVLVGTLTHTTEYAWAGGGLALVGIVVQLSGPRLSHLGRDAMSWAGLAKSTRSSLQPDERRPDASEADGSEAAEAPRTTATVLVIPGRTRFHTRQCSVVQSRSADEIDLESAQAVGLMPCGRCAS